MQQNKFGIKWSHNYPYVKERDLVTVVIIVTHIIVTTNYIEIL